MDRGVPTQTDGLRVALVSEYYYPDIGGMPEHVHQLGRALVGRGHRVTVITTSFPGHVDVPSDTPFDVVRVGRASPPLITNGSLSLAAIGLGLRRKLLRLFAERRFDVIHVHAPIFPTLALLAISCAPPEALLVGTLHTHFERSSVIELFRRPLQRYLDALDGLIAVSDTALRSMHNIGFSCQAEIIPNGVDLAAWQSGRRLPSLRGSAELVLLGQARLEPRNRFETVIAAQRRLFDDGMTLRVHILGEGPRRRELSQLAHGLDTHFAGAVVTARPDFAASSDVFCFTADIASHPMSLIEGMAAALPIIAHPIDGVRQLISDGEEGLLVSLGDDRAYAEALRALYRSIDLRKKLGDLARKRVESLGWPQIARKIESKYLELAKRKRNGRASVVRDSAQAWS